MLRPIVKLLRLVDGEMAVCGKVYHGFFQLTQLVNDMNIADAKKEQLLPLINKRWEQGHSVLHAAAYALDPEFWEHEVNSNSEVCSTSVSFVYMARQLKEAWGWLPLSCIFHTMLPTAHLAHQGLFALPCSLGICTDIHHSQASFRLV